MKTDKIQTPYGIYSGVTTTELYPDGRMQSICLAERNVIVTHAGDLIPFYGAETLRRKNKASVTFHKNGMIKAVALEEQQEVMTPIGEIPAELITFYDTGEVHRVFPLDGKISGFWSEEDERALNIPLFFELDFAVFTAMLSSICFYKSGEIRSITLFPGEQIKVTHETYGPMKVRCGFSLYETGELETLEPAEPFRLKTPVGQLTAFDPNAIGVNADSNSLRFDRKGRVVGILASSEKIIVKRKSDGTFYTFAPAEIETDDEVMGALLIPLRLEFDYDNLSAIIQGSDDTGASFCFADEYFITRTTSLNNGTSCSTCSSCSLCKH